MAVHFLNYEDRKSLEALYKKGEGLPTIAEELGVNLATIYREVSRGSTGELDGNGRYGYSAEIAQKAVQQNRKRCGRKAAENTNKTE